MAVSSTSSSGLDVNAIVSQLMTAERLPVASLEKKIGSVDLQVSSLGTIRSKTAALRAALDGIETPTNFLTRGVTSSRPDAVSATAGAGVPVGTVQVLVKTTAQAESIRFAGYGSASTPVGSGTLTLASGGTQVALTVAPGQTLSGLRDQINSEAGSLVRASVVQTATGQWSLLVTGQQTGAANAVTLDAVPDAADTAGALSALSFGVGSDGAQATRLAAARDAVVKIDGLEITRPSNQIDDAVAGLAIVLRKPVDAADWTAAESSTVDVSRSAGDARGRFEALAAAFNDLVDAVGTATKPSSDSTARGPLNGDSTARELLSQVRSMLVRGFTSSDGKTTSFYEIGLRLQNDGRIQVDSTVLGASINDAFVDRLGNGVWVGLPAGSSVPPAAGTQGLRGWLRDALTLGGMLDTREKAATAQRKDYTDRMTRLEDRLTTVEANYRRRFSSLDAMLTNLNAVSAGLKSALDQLASTYTQK